MTRKVHVQVFFSPSCPFSYPEIEEIRKAVAEFGDQVQYEEINMYERPKEAEKMGFYGLLSRIFIPVFINGQKYKGSLNKEQLSNAIRKALEAKER
jgi:predicted DsbA family dithiol-disulfide isomerase